ncbi:DeSI-like protein [Zea mays]|uniref:DeSI-like protein n=1 Tax=Zea mays TaxID=4577 RepID=A0A1D6E431_MAIZE|nr:DeSI-like protein [Zea mays]
MEAQNGSCGGAPVVLNVYDLTPMNNYLYWFGLGIFHSGIEVHGMEYGFGAHQFPASGVFEVEPKSCPGFIYRRSVWMGTTDLSRAEFRSFIENLAGKYNGNTYHLISKNCNHFTDDVCSFFNCLLPESIQVSTVLVMIRSDKVHRKMMDLNVIRIIMYDDYDYMVDGIGF